MTLTPIVLAMGLAALPLAFLLYSGRVRQWVVCVARPAVRPTHAGRRSPQA